MRKNKYVYEIRAWASDLRYTVVRVYDSPRRIGDPFEDLPFVFHSNWELVDLSDSGPEYVLSRRILADSGERVGG